MLVRWTDLRMWGLRRSFLLEQHGALRSTDRHLVQLPGHEHQAALLPHSRGGELHLRARGLRFHQLSGLGGTTGPEGGRLVASTLHVLQEEQLWSSCPRWVSLLHWR